jgi:hypothetical protein
VWAVVQVPIEKYLGPAEKINITVPRVMLARIDEFAKKTGQSRTFWWRPQDIACWVILISAPLDRVCSILEG